jgi:hypothetical protein
MADLSQNAPKLRFRSEDIVVERWTLDNSAAQTVYYGHPMIIDASADTVNARGWLDATTLVTATDVFLGICNTNKTVVATGGVEGANEVEIITKGEVGFKSATFTDADIGKTVSFTDSGTLAVAAEAADTLSIGKIRRVVDGYVYIELNQHIVTF